MARRKNSNGHWMQNAVHPSRKGDLHRALGVPVHDKIPVRELEVASHRPDHVGQMARFALNARKANRKR